MIVLAADIGGTAIKLGVVSSGDVAVLLASAVIPAREGEGLSAALPRMDAVWREQLEEVGQTPLDVGGVGLGYPSLVDNANGNILMHSDKFTDAPDLNLEAWAQTSWNAPLAIDNDARVACIGEWRYGAGRGKDDVVMITLGTGIGTAVVMRGLVLRGKTGQAGGYGGHLTVDHDGHRCHCGNIGCAEAEAATLVLPARARERPDFVGSRLSETDVVDYRAVFTFAEEGDECSIALRDEALAVWSALVVTHVHAYAPDVVVMGGGIMSSADVIVPVVQSYVDAHATYVNAPVRILPAERPLDAGLLGCSWLIDEMLARRTRADVANRED